MASPRVLNAFIPSLNDICDEFIEFIKQNRDENGLVVDFQSLLNKFGLEASCTLMLGRRMGFFTQEHDSDRIHKLAEAVKQLFIACRDSYYGFGLWKYFPTKTYRDYVRNEEMIYE